MLLKIVAALAAVVALASAQNTPECLQCEFINGQYVFRDDTYCYMYHSCVAPLASVASPRPCPFNQFYDNKSATCKLANSIDCPSDPCKVVGTVSYQNHLNCRSYFKCENGKTNNEMCCAVGQRYDQINGCMVDLSCTDACPPPTSYECGNQRVYISDSAKYEQNIGGNVWILRMCAPGTSFVALNLCRCVGSGPITVPSCIARLNLPFYKNIQDINLRVKVQNGNPRVRVVTEPNADDGKAAKFNGGANERLIVPAYMNAYWGKKLVIQTRFLETGTPPGQKEVILGNGDCGGDASVTIKYDRASSSIEAKIETKNYGGNIQTFMVSVTSIVGIGIWKRVELLYDGMNNLLRLTVVSQGPPQIAVTTASGKIVTKKAALQIGSGCPQNADNFIGYIDYLRVYHCI